MGPTGTVRIAAAFDPLTGPTVAVADEGPGLAESVRERPFEPFATSRAGRVGLGLTLARAICRRHGAHLALQQEPGRGVTVRFQRLPVAP
jgi:signal transduction histidine kinase